MPLFKVDWLQHNQINLQNGIDGELTRPRIVIFLPPWQEITRLVYTMQRRTIPLVIMLLSPVCVLLFGGGGVSAFATTQTKRYGIPTSTTQTNPLPNINGRYIQSRSSCSTSTELYNLLDAVGDMLSGPKLEAESNLPFDPPFCNDVSCSGNIRTFAIKERP